MHNSHFSSSIEKHPFINTKPKNEDNMKQSFSVLVLGILMLTFMGCKGNNDKIALYSQGSNETQSCNQGTYELYPTNNIWNFIKLNTRDGRAWQVQFSMEEDKTTRGEIVINDQKLCEDGKDGRFTLYSTQNIWTYLLLDKTTGKVYQLHWSMSEGQRGVVAVN